METDGIKKQIENAWQEAALKWKDEYAVRFHGVVINELTGTLDGIRNSAAQLNEAMHTALSKLKEFNE